MAVAASCFALYLLPHSVANRVPTTSGRVNLIDPGGKEAARCRRSGAGPFRGVGATRVRLGRAFGRPTARATT
jgi:hypothetical protein